MRKKFLPFSPPFIGEEEINEVVDSLRNGWITTGPKVKRFEEEFAAFVGSTAGLALNSGTAAMHVALAALGIGPGDAVITTPMTFCSSVHVIEQVGARPILVDIEPDTLNIDPNRIEEAIGQLKAESSKLKVRTLLPVHLYGHPCEMDTLLDIARRYGLSLVEDAAHALPAKYKDRMIGSEIPHSEIRIPNLVAFSFYATKNLTTAEGGMLTGPTDLIEEARIWSLHGMTRDAWRRYEKGGAWYYEVIRPGFKYNMTDIAAAMGIQQLRKLNRFQERRRELVRRYNDAFSAFEELQIPVQRKDVEHARHLYVMRLNLGKVKISRNEFIEELKSRNIGTSVHFIPVHVHPYYRDKYGYKPEDFPVTYREYQRILSLPLYPKMSDQDVEDVIEAVTDVVKQFRRKP